MIPRGSGAPSVTKQPAAEEKRIQLVTFRLDQHHFAVPVEQVWRVEALSDFQITRVPGAAAFLEGLINLRGRVIPVIDLKERLGLLSTAAPAEQTPPQAGVAYPAKARLLIVEMEIAGQKDEKVAMIVDKVSDIRWFAAANLRPPPPMVAEISSQYLHGVLEEEGRLWIVLELRQVLSIEERRSLRSEANQAQDTNTDQNTPFTTPEAPNEQP
jgi:purine-binding chemotaxis protein CheW